MDLSIKTLKTLESEMLTQLESENYANEDNHISEYFTPEETKVVQEVLNNKLELKDAWRKYINDINETYDCDTEEETKLNIFYDYIESKFNNRSLTFNQYVKNQIKNL